LGDGLIVFQFLSCRRRGLTALVFADESQYCKFS
jgi:hypothetical protein